MFAAHFSISGTLGNFEIFSLSQRWSDIWHRGVIEFYAVGSGVRLLVPQNENFYLLLEYKSIYGEFHGWLTIRILGICTEDFEIMGYFPLWHIFPQFVSAP